MPATPVPILSHRPRQFLVIVSLLAGVSGCQDGNRPLDENRAPALSALAALAALPAYTRVDLGGLPGVSFSYATDINEEGRIVGVSYQVSSPPRGFLREPNGTMLDLGSLGGLRTRASWALAVNNRNQVTGYADTRYREHAFFWSRKTRMVNLGTLGGEFSQGNGINNLGQVVGSAARRDGSSHAFLWSATTGMIDLGTLGGVNSSAGDINDAGQVVGSSDVVGGSHAMLWTAAGGMLDLGTLGGHNSVATGINRLGEVVGGSETASGERHMFAWTAAAGMVDAGAFGGGYTLPWDISDQGLSVGTFYLPDGNYHGFVAPRGGPFVDIDTVDYVVEALGVNSCGQVVGRADNHASLWDTPCP